MSSSEMVMGCVGMRSRGGVGVGTFFGTSFKRGAFGALFRVTSGVGAGGVVEIVEDEVGLVELVGEGGQEDFGAMVLDLRRPGGWRECQVLAALSQLRVGTKSLKARSRERGKNDMWPFPHGRY